MWEDIQQAYKVENNADFDDKWTTKFTSLEEVIAIYDKVRRDREAHRAEFHSYVYKKSAELDAMKRAEIAAIEAKYDQKKLTFSKFINQRLQTMKPTTTPSSPNNYTSFN
uniref:Inhibitor_I29 domain-containing protein n=1 Tax=Panagrellus redivivus TaxID=6233 RepID=A0A7E4UTJ1_PANRE